MSIADPHICFRFAPSPTGYLHLGHALAAFMAYEGARNAEGRFLLRIEDIDTERCRPHFETAIYEDLAWLGLDWEMPVRRQSDERTLYRDAIDRLAHKQLLYPCFCTRSQISAHAGAKITPDGAPFYAGTCKQLSRDERESKIRAGLAYQLRLDLDSALSQISGPLEFVEEGLGPQQEHGAQQATPYLFGDVVLARKDMPVSYHLCVTVDDALQNISHVTRGEDLFPATHVHRLLQALLDLPVPLYRHHRLVRDEEGKRLSKHNKSTGLRDLRAQGVSVSEIRKYIGLNS